MFLGYHSDKFSINYLFSLLKYIQEVELPFDFADEKEKALYQLWYVNSDMSTYNEVQYNSIEDSKLIED